MDDTNALQTVGVEVADETKPQPRAGSPAPRIGVGIEAKLFFFLIMVLAALSLMAAMLSSRQMTHELTNEFKSKGTAIATGLAAASTQPLASNDTAILRGLVDRFAEIEGVAYVLVYDPSRTLSVHTFGSAAVPQDLKRFPELTEAGMRTTELVYVEPSTSQIRSIIDIAAPVRGGRLGGVRIGMDRDETVRAARDAMAVLVITLGATALLAALAGLYLTRRTIRPIRRLVVIARKVGRGDLSELAPVQSRDEIGLLAHTFNDTITRLRGVVQTEEERDEERRKREALQANIASFLDVSTVIAQGDLTRRGEVTSDVLGAVVDSINVMVEEIGETLLRVQGAAGTVTSGSQDMIRSTEQMVEGVQTQSKDAARVHEQVAELTRAMRLVADSASSSANAARQTREAADAGQEAVHETLRSMQRIRREVQSISQRVKSLGERSMEISEIVDTISAIASQTNLLALNAAIEASGAGPYGVRFAVVADEVRKLAEGSAQAAKRVASLIKAIQTEVQEAIVAMEAGNHEVEAGFRVNTTAGERLIEIAEISSTSADLAAEISTSAAAQVQGIDGVANSVSSIAEIAARTEQEVLDGRQVAEQLLNLSDELNRYLSRFKLAD